MTQPPPDYAPPTSVEPGSRLEDADARTLPRKATILCVDDEPDALSTLEWFLTYEGFTVTTAASGAEALSSVRQGLPDFIITDQSMPGMSGLEFCKQLRMREETRHVPIILYTALKLPALSWLYNQTLLKPTDLDVLGGAVRTLLASAH